MRRILKAAAVVIWTAFLLTVPAAGQEDAASLLDGAIKALGTVAFDGRAKSLPRGLRSRFPVVNRVVHIPPDLYRVEPIGPGHPPFFFIESSKGSFKVDEETQQVVPLRPNRLKEANEFLAKFLGRLKGQTDLKVTRMSFLSRPAWRIAHNDNYVISIVVDDATRYPLKYEVVGPRGQVLVYHEFISITFIQSPESVDMRMFSPPPGYEQLHPPPRAPGRVNLFPIWEQKAKEPEFLPLMPAYYPPGFELTGVAPLAFKGNLIFHLQMRDFDRDTVISVFESKNPRMEQLSQQKRGKPRGVNVYHAHLEGIFILVVGRQKMDILKKIADSLEEDDILAYALLEHEERLGGPPGPPPPGPPGPHPPR